MVESTVSLGVLNTHRLGSVAMATEHQEDSLALCPPGTAIREKATTSR